MAQMVENFWRSESGAVTVDWVVITSVIILMVLVTVPPIVFEANAKATRTADELSRIELNNGR